MKHRKKGRKFSRQRDQRRALIKSLLANLILKEKISTTLAKAKEIRPLIEKLITKSKKPNLAVVRLLNAKLPKKAVNKIIKHLGPRYGQRQGGYSRIIKTGLRKDDRAKMAIIELIK